MRRPLLVLLIAAWAGLAALNPAGAATASYPENSRIGLVLPPGDLQPSTHFPGFEDSAHHLTITLLDLPGAAYDQVEQSAFGETVKGLTVEKRELFPFAGGIGFLITGRAEIDGKKVRSWYLLVNTFTRETGRIAAFIRVHVPEDARSAYPDAAIRAALKSVTFRAPPLAALLDHLLFKIKDRAGFRVMRVAPPTLAMLIDGPVNDPTKHPYMVISLSRGAPSEPTAQARFARDLIVTAPLKDIAVTSMESMRIGGRPGIEVRANAKGPDGAPLALVQWLRFGGASTFLRVIGVGPSADWDKLFPRFRAVRDGIDLH